MIRIEVEVAPRAPFSWEEKGQMVLQKALDIIGCPYVPEINVLITDSEAIRLINQDFRNKNSTTDVLSFPANEFKVPENFDVSSLDFFPETQAVILGDIVINADFVFTQAASYGHSPLREYAFLLVHSLLHLVGHDHMAEEEERRMRMRQREILEILEIGR